MKKNFQITKAIKFGFLEYFNNFRFYLSQILLSLIPGFAGGMIFLILTLAILLLVKIWVPEIRFNLFNYYYFSYFLQSTFLLSFFIRSVSGSEVRASLQELISKKRWKFIWIRFKYNFLVMVGIVLLIIPGIFWYIKYYFRGYSFLTQNISDSEDLKEAKNITSKVRLKLLLFEIIWFILALPFFLFFFPSIRKVYYLFGLANIIHIFLYWPIHALSSISVYNQLSAAEHN